MKLVILACSATKRPDTGLLPAIQRYDGPMWRTLRARLAELPAARQAYASGDLRIMMLSALCGFKPVDRAIPDYDHRMTRDLAARLADDPSCDFQSIPPIVREAEAVLFAGGDIYRDAMWEASGGSLWNLMKITETDAGGIGHHRAQLSAWLTEHFGSDQDA
ncbi:hypothetical protein Swit_2217 [Rhizorhabdus wittichii RW1]|uniref:Uncharacterized protein n=1 Tax=Rhizorhabdus wittichii (strain DSM 6014 / CCUG 31198 / JCM 15750 / NBRC 105917 / EY 4224 / RW1) TaxID=392499 RepID=A0A9J9HBJ5_RHIWR|nr:hypothetical protein Swit_2217 [Rhizorhabdus wittichii RW1]